MMDLMPPPRLWIGRSTSGGTNFCIALPGHEQKNEGASYEKNARVDRGVRLCYRCFRSSAGKSRGPRRHSSTFGYLRIVDRYLVQLQSGSVLVSTQRGVRKARCQSGIGEWRVGSDV